MRLQIIISTLTPIICGFLCAANSSLASSEDQTAEIRTFNSLLVNTTQEPLAMLRLQDSNTFTGPVLSCNPQGVTLDLSSQVIPDHNEKMFSWGDIVELPAWLLDKHRSHVLNAASNCIVQFKQGRLEDSQRSRTYVLNNKAYYSPQEYSQFVVEWNSCARNEMRQRIFRETSNALQYVEATNLSAAATPYDFVYANRKHLTSNELNQFELEWRKANQALELSVRNENEMREKVLSAASNALRYVEATGV